jgi:hypothetical protein
MMNCSVWLVTYSFLQQASDGHSQPFPLAEQDFAFLKALEATLIHYGIATPAKPKK